MRKLAIFVVALFLLPLSVTAPVRADYVNQDLEAASERRKTTIKRSWRVPVSQSAADRYWRTAKRFADRRQWRNAIAYYGRAAASGSNSTAFWVQYSYALGFIRPQRYMEALETAYLGYKAARSPQERAQALGFVGFWYEALREYDPALTAYEESLKLRRTSNVQRRFDRLVQRFRQQVTRTAANSETDVPQVCLTFSQNLPAKNVKSLETFISVKPAIKAALEVSGKRLCIGGVEHGKAYEVTVREGLPSTTDKKVQVTRTYTIAVPDRKPQVGFRGSAYILPRTSRQGIPLTSINVSGAQLRLYRINDRNLVSQINQNKLRELLYSYDARRIQNQAGELVWTGSMDIESVKNKQITTAVPASEILKQPKPGVYVLLARSVDNKKRYGRWATQWLVISDLGISTYSGQDGLTVFARSFASAKPLTGVTVRLIARNNKVLGTATSDATGRVQFAPGLTRGTGGNRPAAVTVATSEGDYNFLDLTRPAFDLSDRGVTGRVAPGPIDAFLYTERGVYRPGETVYLSALLRNEKATAITGMPLTLRLYRPDGVEARRFTVKADGKSGGYSLSIPMSKASRTGGWQIRAYVDPKGKPVGRVRFQVEDFVPEKMEMSLKAEVDALVPGKPNSIKVDGRYLYGAPAAGLTVDAEMFLRQDNRPYPEFAKYQFGLVTEAWRQKRVQLKSVTTDGKGAASIALSIADAPQTTRSLKAVVQVSLLEPGGRALSRSISIPIRSQPLVIGVRLDQEGDTVPNGAKANFQVIALDQDGKPRAAEGLQYVLYRETYQYHWYFRNNRWNYRLIRRDDIVSKGAISVAADKPKAFGFSNDWGLYRLEVRDPKGQAATSIRYRVGWFVSSGSTNVPDKLSVKLDKTSYKAGETAKVALTSPFKGTAQIVVANDKVLESRSIDVEQGATTVDIQVKEDWGPGAYVMVTAYRPIDQAAKRGPARAVGLAYLKRDMSAQTLKVAIDAPEKIEPRRKVSVSLSVTGAANEPVFVTLAAVDEGILSLTGYASPSPSKHYYGRRTLGIDLRDDYGKLIDAFAGRLGQVRTGGDAASRHLGGLDASSIKTVSLYSGIVSVDAQGKATITLDVPDFNGRLRLMAVAWTRNAVGQSESKLTVRDKVVSIVTLPRFLAPRDRGQMTVSLHNVDGEAGRYNLAIKTTGVVRVAGATTFVRQLAKDARGRQTITLTGVEPGVGNISMTLSGPGGFTVTRSWNLAVRPAQAVVTRQTTKQLAKGQALTYGANLVSEFLPGTAKVTISVSNAPNMGVAALVRALNGYPYGCAEQTTSKALPMLYLANVAESIGVAEDKTALRAKVQASIYRVMTMQARDGGFGMWTAYDSNANWLSAYVMDFLTQARAKKYFVPDYAFSRGLDRLQSIVENSNYAPANLPVLAYAYYVLAQNKKTDLASLRYLADNQLDRMPTALARAQLAAALALYGDKERADKALASAQAYKERPRLTGAYWRQSVRDYGSYLRDRSGVLYLTEVSRPGSTAIPKLVEEVNRLRTERRYHSTQEQAWMLLAAHSLMSKGKGYRVVIGNDDQGDRTAPLFKRVDLAALRKGLTVRNAGADKLWQTVTVSGIPRADMPAQANGLSIKRVIYTVDGKRANLANVRQSDVYVVVVQVSAQTPRYHQALLVDLLPAGFEIENARLVGGQSAKNMKWLPKLITPRFVEPRDDRYVAAIDIAGRSRSFYVAYLVRAVTPGTFRLPATHIEDMYAPSYFARGAIGTVVVRERK